MFHTQYNQVCKINTAGASVNTADRPVNTAGSKTTVNHSTPIYNAYKKGYLQITRPFNKYSANKNCIFNKKVSTVRVKDTTAKDTAVVSENKEKEGNAGNPHHKEYKEKGVIDSGCSRYITGNKCYLTEYEDYDGGFVSFGDGKGQAMRVFNKRTRIVEKTLNIRFFENAPNVTGNGPDWLFDVDSLTISMIYVPFVAGNQTNGIAGTRDNIVAGQAEKKTEPEQEYILIPFFTTDPLISQGEEDEQDTRSEFERLLQQEKQTNSTNSFNIVGTPVSAAGPSFTNVDPSSPVNVAEASNVFEDHLIERFSPFKNAFALPHVPNVSPIDDNTGIFASAYDDEDVGGQADLNNLETTMNVSSIPTTRINKDHIIELIIGDLHSALLTRRMSQQNLEEHCLVSYINKQRRTNHKDYQNCLFACFLSQKEPKKVIQALKDPSWIEAIQEELLQFELQKVWTLVDLPNGKRPLEQNGYSETR
ncbi:hypothetical protein Tco_1430805 [Tanacetum coccineum]